MRRGLYTSLAAQWASAAMSIISSVLVARMMLPTELGVFTVAMSLIAILATIQTAGTNEFLLYTADIKLETRRSVFGLTIILTCGIAAIVIATAPFVARFYSSPGMALVLQLAAINILLGTLVSPISAMFTREQKFQTIAMITLASNFVLYTGQVLLVWLGYSYLGLSYALVASAAVYVAGNMIFGGEYMIWRPSFRGIRAIANFTSKMLAANIVQQIINNSAPLLIGRLGGTGEAALYGRANMISQIYNQTIGRAVEPIVNAQIAEEGRAGKTGRDSLISSSRILIVLSTAFFGFTGIAAHLIVPLIFGPQWVGAVDAMRILSIALIIMPLNAPTTALVLAAARPGYLLRQRLVNLVCRIGLLIALAPLGIAWAAAAVSIAIYIALLQSLLAAHFIARISVREFVGAILPSGLVGMASVVICAASLWLFDAVGLGAWPQLICAGVVLVIVWLAAIGVTRHPIWTELVFLFGKFVSGSPAAS